MINYINQIHSAFQSQSESQLLEISGSREEGYQFRASALYEESVAQRTRRLFTEIFATEIEASDRLTKGRLREIFVDMALFNENGPRMMLTRREELDTIFLGQAPVFENFSEDRAQTSGKGFQGLCEIVYLQWLHYFSTQVENNDEKNEIRQAEFLTSRLADREFDEGDCVYLGNQQIFRVDKIAVRQGAYISVLRNVMHPSKIKIVCRGTAMRKTATDGMLSGLNDLQYEIGNSGVQAAWEILSDYLARQGNLEVEIYGKSLGGAHAQRLAILVMGLPNCLLKALTTNCSVGVGSEAEALFKNLVERDERYRDLKLTVIRNGGGGPHAVDYIPCLGGDHLGSTVEAECLNLQVYYIHPSSPNIYAPIQDLNIFQKCHRLVTSFSGPHVRQTTLGDFFFRKITERREVQKELTLGRMLEGPRRFIAYKNTLSFTEFVHSPFTVTDTALPVKIGMAVSSIFFVLFYVGFMTCLVLQPGAVVYQGAGIVLTLPAVLMAEGGVLSLAAIAIGSCAWWRSSRRGALMI